MLARASPGHSGAVKLPPRCATSRGLGQGRGQRFELARQVARWAGEDGFAVQALGESVEDQQSVVAENTWEGIPPIRNPSRSRVLCTRSQTRLLSPTSLRQ